MHRELLDALSVITEEEQRILDEQRGIDPQLYTEKKELIVDSEKLLKKGKLIQVRPHTRFVNFPKHKHNYVEVIYMCQGTTTHILNGSKVILEAGDLLFLNQNAEQEILPAGEQDIAVNFIVLPEFFDTAFSMMDMEEENALKEFLVGALCGRMIRHHICIFMWQRSFRSRIWWKIWYGRSSMTSRTKGDVIRSPWGFCFFSF